MTGFKASVDSATRGTDPEILGVVVLAVDREGMARVSYACVALSLASRTL
jgi:hypothetical protein